METKKWSVQKLCGQKSSVYFEWGFGQRDKRRKFNRVQLSKHFKYMSKGWCVPTARACASIGSQWKRRWWWHNGIFLSFYYSSLDTDHSSPWMVQSLHHLTKDTFTLTGSLLWKGNGYTGGWMNCKVGSYWFHTLIGKNTPLGLLQTKWMLMKHCKGQTWDQHYRQWIMPHTQVLHSC